MQELINKLMSDAGLTAEQAQKALHTVVSHVKSVLPAGMGANIDVLMGANAPIAEAPKAAEAGMMDKASDMAGAAKDKLSDMADSAKEKLTQFTSTENIENLKDQAEALKDTATEKLGDLADKAEDLAEGAINKLKGLFGGNKEA